MVLVGKELDMALISIEPSELEPGYRFEVTAAELHKLRTEFSRDPAPRTRAVLEERIGRSFTEAQLQEAAASYKKSRLGVEVAAELNVPPSALSKPGVPKRRANGRKPQLRVVA